METLKHTGNAGLADRYLAAYKQWKSANAALEEFNPQQELKPSEPLAKIEREQWDTIRASADDMLEDLNRVAVEAIRNQSQDRLQMA